MEDNKTEQGKRKSEKCNEGIVENAERTGGKNL